MEYPKIILTQPGDGSKEIVVDPLNIQLVDPKSLHGRTWGSLKDRAIFLPDTDDWAIVRDEADLLCLVALKTNK